MGILFGKGENEGVRSKKHPIQRMVDSLMGGNLWKLGLMKRAWQILVKLLKAHLLDKG